jgi:hypothetical protein
MARCIYCLEERPADAFNREHVVPEAFGKFEQNLVLDCVCKSCNDFFGKTLDLKLGRDTVEGLDRFRSGLKTRDEYKGLGRQSTSRVEVMEGPLKGVLCEYRPAANGKDFDIVGFIPQLGFAQTQDGPFEYHPLAQLPTKDDLIARGFQSPVYFRIYGTTSRRAWPVLRRGAFPRANSLVRTRLSTAGAALTMFSRFPILNFARFQRSE